MSQRLSGRGGVLNDDACLTFALLVGFLEDTLPRKDPFRHFAPNFNLQDSKCTDSYVNCWKATDFSKEEAARRREKGKIF